MPDDDTGMGHIIIDTYAPAEHYGQKVHCAAHGQEETIAAGGMWRSTVGTGYGVYLCGRGIREWNEKRIAEREQKKGRKAKRKKGAQGKTQKRGGHVEC